MIPTIKDTFPIRQTAYYGHSTLPTYVSFKFNGEDLTDFNGTFTDTARFDVISNLPRPQYVKITVTHGDGTTETIDPLLVGTNPGVDNKTTTVTDVYRMNAVQASVPNGYYAVKNWTIVADPRPIGLFKTLYSLYSAYMPGWDLTMMDEYFINKCASKVVNRMVYDKLHVIGDQTEITGETVFTANQAVYTYYAPMIWTAFGESWIRTFAALNESYAPLENYDMTEESKPGQVKTTVRKQKIHSTGKSSAYAFNSGTSPVPVSSTEADSETTGADSANTDTETMSGTNELTRHGNIGVTTSQQMLMSEWDVRTKYRFFDMLCKDAASILTSPYYAPYSAEF